MYCSRCGSTNRDDATYCSSCGAPVSGSASAGLGSEVVYAGFWLRLLAALIDGVIISSATQFVAAVLTLGHPFVHLVENSFVSTVVHFLYVSLFDSSKIQATPGMALFGMVVTDLEGDQISFNRAAGRYFASILSGLILGIGYLMIAFTARRQALHDLICDTLVLRG